MNFIHKLWVRPKFDHLCEWNSQHHHHQISNHSNLLVSVQCMHRMIWYDMKWYDRYDILFCTQSTILYMYKNQTIWPHPHCAASQGWTHVHRTCLCDLYLPHILYMSLGPILLPVQALFPKYWSAHLKLCYTCFMVKPEELTVPKLLCCPKSNQYPVPDLLSTHTALGQALAC